MKRALIAVIVVFVVVEGWLVTQAMDLRRSLADSIVIAFKEPATQMMGFDFLLFGGIVFFWMLSDSKKRGKNGWLWLPLMILAPTIALAGYLLARGSTNEAKMG